MWRFVQVTDTHIGGTEDRDGSNRVICTLMPDVIRCLRKDLTEVSPDFVLATGDIATEQTRDAIFAARDLLDSLGIRYYPVGGDADFARDGGRDWFVDAFQAQLPVRDTVYSFTHKGLHISVLDPWWRWPDGTLSPSLDGLVGNYCWQIPPHQFEWLEHDLTAHAELPTLIALHCPAVDVPPRLKARGCAEKGHLGNRGLLFKLLERHKQVKAIFSGHAHMNFIAKEGDLTHIVTAGLAEYPVEYRVISVFADRLEVSTQGLSDESFAAHSLIGENHWGTGEDCDRRAVIPFSA